MVGEELFDIIDIIDKIKLKEYVSSISSYDFSTLYTSLPHSKIKDKLTQLIQKTFGRERKLYLACNFSKAFFTHCVVKNYTMWTCNEVCDALTFLLDNIYVRFGSTIYRQTIGIPMGTNCAPLVADLFLYCYERDFMLSLAPDNQSDIIEAFNNTSRYLDDIFNINNPFFPNFIHQIYPSELTLNKANQSDVRSSFLDLDLHLEKGRIISKIYDKRDDFNFETVNYPHLDGDVPRSTSYGVYASQLLRFARACSRVEDFNSRNLIITKKLLHQGFRYHKLRKTLAKTYYRNFELFSNYNTPLKSLLRQGISNPDFYGDVLYRLRKILDHVHFHTIFTKLLKRFIKRGYDPLVLQQTSCLLMDPFTIHKYASYFIAR